MRAALQVLVYVFLYLVTAMLCAPLLGWLGGYLAGITATGLLASSIANLLSLRIYERHPFADIGLHLGAASGYNLGIGILGGIGSACLVLGGPLLAGVARLRTSPGEATLGSFFFVTLMLLFGAAGEELLFRGYGFQVLLRALGPWATILPVGLLFGLLHSANPSFNRLALANTIGFGVLFGYAFWRSRDLWLPIGLHFGWNFTLPVFGVNVSGIKMRVTGLVMDWSAGTLWSGADYGPEGSLLTSGVLLVLFAFLWKAPIRRQPSPLLDPSAEDPSCVPGPPQ